MSFISESDFININIIKTKKITPTVSKTSFGSVLIKALKWIISVKLLILSEFLEENKLFTLKIFTSVISLKVWITFW